MPNNNLRPGGDTPSPPLQTPSSFSQGMQVIPIIYTDAQYMNDLWEFNTLTLEWIQHQTCGEIPASRSNCTMHYDAQHNNIIIFGGGGPNKKRFNNVSILDWSTKEWKEIAAESSEKSPW